MPARPDDEPRDQRLLCEIKLQSPAFEPALNGIALIKPVEGRNIAAGLASWYRFKSADGAAISDGNMGSEGTSLNIGMPQLPEHALIRVENFALSISNVVR